MAEEPETTRRAEYPRRPRFFSHRFTRLMARVCLANEVGPEVCWLLTVIVNTEDAKGYRGAVTYFNDQLASVVGFGAVSSLDRFRRKAIDAGWLHYEPGARRKAGRYWVTVPERFENVKDGPLDHDWTEYTNGEIPSAGEEESAQESGSYPEVIRKESAQESGSYPEGKCSPFFPSPLPSPLPVPKTEESPEVGRADSGPTDDAPPDPVVMEFPCNGTGPKVWHLRESKVTEYRGSFPGIDLDAELRKARQWAIDNPKKRKTAVGMTKFLGGWLGRAQDDPGRAGGLPARPGVSREQIVQKRQTFINRGRPPDDS